MKKILSLFHARWIKPQVVTPWEGCAFYFPNVQFTRLASETNNARIDIIRPNLRRIVSLIEQESVDAVFCGEMDAVLVQFVLRKLKKRIPPFIIEDLTTLRGAGDACRWIEKTYDENPFHDMVRDENNYWLYYVPSFRKDYVQKGMPARNLLHVPGTTFLMGIMNPDVTACIENEEADNQLQRAVKTMEGKLFAGGSTNRDYGTFVKACSGMPYEAHIVTDKRNYDTLTGMLLPGHVFPHCYLPLPMFISAVRRASVVAVPLRSTFMSCGHFTLALAMRLKKPVVMSRVPSSEGYIEHGKNGLLAEPESAGSLRKHLRYFCEHPEEAGEMGARAFEHEKTLSAQAVDAFRELIAHVAARRKHANVKAGLC